MTWQAPEARTLPRFFAAAVAEAAEHPFLTADDDALTYDQVDRLSNQAAHLWRSLGVGHGDRVVFAMDNCPEFLYAWLGLAKLGAVLVAINPRFQAEEATYLVQHSGAGVGLVDAAHADVLAGVRERGCDLPCVVSTGDGGDGATFAERLAAQPEDGVDAPVVPDDVLTLIYTSGTTGLPKAVMQTHRSFVLTGEAYASWLQMTAADRAYVCLPLAHINAQAYSTMGIIAARATMVLAPRFSATAFWPDVRRHGVTMFNFIGAMMVILAKSEPAPDDADNDVRVAYSGSVAGLSLEQRRALEQRYGLRLRTGFGMSETTFGFVDPADEPARPGSIGKPRSHPDPSLPASEVRIVREDGSDTTVGETGELLLRNATLMGGYFEDPERTSTALVDGWLHTGDLAYRDEDGWYYFVDRKKDVIRRRGENVSSTEVERVLATHPSVRQAAVIGVPSEMMDEDILAFVHLDDGSAVQAEELWTWVAGRLASFKVPRYIEFTAELPLTSTQKIAKAALKEFAKTSPGPRHDREVAR